MNSARLPQLGSVVWAELEDANGFRKTRPAVVLTASADIAAGKPLRVVAITTRLPKPLPDDHVLLPWDPQGKARSCVRGATQGALRVGQRVSGKTVVVVHRSPPRARG